MTIRIELQPQVYQKSLDRMLFGSTNDVLGDFKGIPSGGFTNIEGPVTQFTTFETPLRITSDNVGQKHTIRATLISLDNNTSVANQNRVVEKVVVPINDIFVVSLPLRKGENQIDVFTHNDGSFTSVIASHVGTFVTAYAREIFNSTQNALDEQTRALFSKFSSRMTEMLIPFQDLYANPKSLRTLISRFVTRAYMTKNSSTQGVRDFGAALLGTTPIFAPTKTDEGTFEPNVVPLFRRQLEFSGFEAHTWIPNYEIAHWLSFIKLVDAARNYYTIQEIGESEVLVTAGGIPETHRFDFDDPEATAYSEFNFTDFRIVVEILNKFDIIFCAAGYPFDLFVSADNPLGQKRLTFDSLIPFDSGELLDQPAIDPGDDGWVGFPLSGRFDRFTLNETPIEHALDSLFIIPALDSTLDRCAYDGFFTQQLELFSQETDIPFSLSAEGEVSDVVGTSEENVSIDEFRADTTILDFSNFSEFSLGGFLNPGPITIASNSTIALGGTSSVQFIKEGGALLPAIRWTNSGPPLDLTNIGANTLYLTMFLGEDALEPTDSGVPSYPGKLLSIIILIFDGSGGAATYQIDKENLVPGVNVIPIFLDFDNGSGGFVPSAGDLDRSDITGIWFFPRSVTPLADLYRDFYLGRMHVLANEAHFRPARAKIELDDIDNVFAQSLYGSELKFADPDGVETVFTGDETYNDLDENAYVPRSYKVQLTAGTGTQGFDRVATAENLRLELGRQGSFVKSTVVNNLPDGEIYLDVFSKEFSTTGSRNDLSFSTDPANPVTPDLISPTSFSGGLEGQNTRLGGGTGNLTIAQQFKVTGSSATLRFVELFLHRLGLPSGSLNVAIHEDSSSDPAGTAPGLLIAGAVDKFAMEITDEIPNYEIFLFNETLLTPGIYWIVVSGDTVYEATNDAENHIIWAMSSTGSSLASATTDGNFTGGSFWTVTSLIHHFFKAIGNV